MKEQILRTLRTYPLAIEVHNETFKVIADYIDINEICFRNIDNVHIVGDVLWIGNASIDIKDVKKFSIKESECFQMKKDNIRFKLVENKEE